MNHFILSIGSNLGNRAKELSRAVAALRGRGVEVLRWSSLFETAPMHIVDQPAFLNAALWCRAPHDPQKLLAELKSIEREAGRDPKGQRFGPRPVDLDIVSYNGARVAMSDLEIPHPRWQERDFVVAPVAELAREEDALDISHGIFRHALSPGRQGPGLHAPSEVPGAAGVARFASAAARLWASRREQLVAAATYRQDGEGEGLAPGPAGRSLPPLSVYRVLPLPSTSAPDATWRWQGQARIMGVLNCTPDSFSDGGRLGTVGEAVAAARRMVEEGAAILDVGGQSTRPGAARVSPEEESARVLPVIQALSSDPLLRSRGTILSVDTFYADVALGSIQRGAHMINDISAGTLDPRMVPTIASLDTPVPFAAMHIRGDPSSMQHAEHVRYGSDVASQVGAELAARCRTLVAAGIDPWRLILDPGVGFSKTGEGNCQLIAGLDRFASEFSPFGALGSSPPILVGSSRKGFLGTITGRKSPEDRDVASAAAAVAAVQRGAAIVRVHNVAAARDALAVTTRLLWAGVGDKPRALQLV